MIKENSNIDNDTKIEMEILKGYTKTDADSPDAYTPSVSELENNKNLRNYQLSRDRQRRIIWPPQRLDHADLISYAFSVGSQIGDDEPTNIQEAIKSKNRESWYQAMTEEMDSLRRNDT